MAVSSSDNTRDMTTKASAAVARAIAQYGYFGEKGSSTMTVRLLKALDTHVANAIRKDGYGEGCSVSWNTVISPVHNIVSTIML